MYEVKQSSTAYPLIFFMADASDHITGKTGLTLTVTISKNGGSFATPSGSVTEIANGWYKVAGNATDTATLGPLALHATGTGADPTDVMYRVVAYDPQDTVRLGLTALPNAAYGAAGGLNSGILNQGTAAGIANGTITLASGHGLSGLASAMVVLLSGTAAAGKSRIITYSGSGDVFNVDPAWNDAGETTPSGTISYIVVPLPPTPTSAVPAVDVVKWKGQTAATVDSNGYPKVTVKAGTGTGELNLSAGVVDANVTKFGGTNATASGGRPEVNTSHIAGSAVSTSSAQLGVNVVNWKGSAAPNMTGDAYARLGAPAGASVSADIAAVKSDSGAVKTVTDKLDDTLEDQGGGTYGFTEAALQEAPAGGGGGGGGDATEAKQDQILALLGTPSDLGSGDTLADNVADLDAQLAILTDGTNGLAAIKTLLTTVAGYVDTEVAAIKAKTDNLPGSPAAVSNIPTAAQNALALIRALAGQDGYSFTRTGTSLSVVTPSGTVSADLTEDVDAPPVVALEGA